MARPLSFLEKSPEAVLRDIIGFWQGNTGRVLYPSQIENLEMHTLAYRESLLRGEIQWCAEQNLVEYAIGPHLDALGAMLGCPRLAPAKAECKVQFLRSYKVGAEGLGGNGAPAPPPAGIGFPAGTVVSTEDGKVSFETAAPAFILGGKLESSIVTARCTVPGKIGNGLEAGVVCSLDPGVNGIVAANVTITEGGAEVESDSAYRARLLLAPGRFGCGGTKSAYRAWALGASALVADAHAVRACDEADPPQGATSAEPGNINIYFLTTDGNNKDTIGWLQDTLQTEFMRDDVRLINDRVFVWPATKVPYTIKARITVFSGFDPQAALEQARAAAYDYAERQRQRLGMDITSTQILMAMSPNGEALYHVNLLEPSGILEVGEKQWACAAEIDIELAFPETCNG